MVEKKNLKEFEISEIIEMALSDHVSFSQIGGKVSYKCLILNQPDTKFHSLKLQR